MGEKKSRRQQIKDEILKAGKITAIRNTKASGKQVPKGTIYKVPSPEMTIEDALELVLIKKAATGVVEVQKDSNGKKDPTVEELKAEAKELGIEGFHNMKKADLIIAITTAKDNQ